MKSNLSEHNFGTTFLGGTNFEAEVYDPEKNDIEKVQIWDPHKHPEAWNYLHKSGNIFFNIVTTFDELNISTSLIEKCYTEELIKTFSNSSVLTYLFKNWISRYTTLYEISLLLVNEVMELDIYGRIGTIKRIETRLETENSQVHLIVKNMKELVETTIYKCGNQKLWDLNIDIKHYGKFHHDNISDISWLEIQEKCGISDEELSSKIIIIENVNTEIKTFNDKMYVAIDNLLSKLNIDYEKRFNELKT